MAALVLGKVFFPSNNSALGTLALIWALLIVSAGILAPLMIVAATPYMAQQFPTRVRSTGLGTVREISGAVAGGLTPLAALTMVIVSPGNVTWGVSLLLMACAALFIVGVFFDQKPRVQERMRVARTNLVDSVGVL